MAVTSNRTIAVSFTSGLAFNVTTTAAANTNSPAVVSVVSLTTGANNFTPPSGGTVPSGVMIIPPVGNTQTLTLKGVTGDTGIPLHLTDPGFVTLATTATTFCITSGGVVTGLRLVYS